MKLAAVRTGVVLGSVSAAAIYTAGAAVTSTAPFAVCAPLALAYEPVRRYRAKRGKSKRPLCNPFAQGMTAGCRLSMLPIYYMFFVCYGDDDD